MGFILINPFTNDSAKSKTDKFYQNYKPGTIDQQFPNEWLHFRVLSIESKLRKLCIAKDFTLGAKGLKVATHMWEKIKTKTTKLQITVESSGLILTHVIGFSSTTMDIAQNYIHKFTVLQVHCP